MKNFFPLAFIFLFFCTSVSAQDLIIKKDGTKIYCQITAEDSVSISYFRAAQKNKTVISKIEVEKYYINSPQKSIRSMGVDSGKVRDELMIIKIMGGYANPVSDFGSKDLEKETAGLAISGRLLQASIILKLTRYFGFSADYRYQKNGVDNGLIEQAFFAGAPAGLKQSVETGHWLSKGFFGGLYFNAPIKTIKNFSLDFTVLGGLPKFESPELAFSFSQGGNSGWVTQYSGKTSGAAFLGKMGFNYKIDWIAFNFGISYFTAKPSFTNVLIKDYTGGLGYTKFEQKFSTINVDAGISLLLYR